MLLSSIFRHSSTTPLRIRSIYSSSIKVSIKLFSLSLSLTHFSTFLLTPFPLLSLCRWLHKTTLLDLTKFTTMKSSTPPISLMPWLTFVLFSLVTISITSYSSYQIKHCLSPIKHWHRQTPVIIWKKMTLLNVITCVTVRYQTRLPLEVSGLHSLFRFIILWFYWFNLWKLTKFGYLLDNNKNSVFLLYCLWNCCLLCD